jgi:hypothetical protein
MSFVIEYSSKGLHWVWSYSFDSIGFHFCHERIVVPKNLDSAVSALITLFLTVDLANNIMLTSLSRG